jgi:hypothetical protein
MVQSFLWQSVTVTCTTIEDLGQKTLIKNKSTFLFLDLYNENLDRYRL